MIIILILKYLINLVAITSSLILEVEIDKKKLKPKISLLIIYAKAP